MPRYRIGDRTFSSVEPLNDEQLRKLVQKVQPPLSEYAEMAKEGANDVASGLRFAGAFTGPAGAAVTTTAAQGIEMLTGKREEFKPSEVLANSMLAAIPGGGPTKTAIGALARGAGLGVGSVTLQSLIEDRELPSVGKLALGTAVGLITGGGMHAYQTRALRASLKEISDADVADRVADMLMGRTMPDATPAVQDEARQLSLAVKKIPAKPMSTGYRNRAGRFASLEGATPFDPPLSTPYRREPEQLELGLTRTPTRVERPVRDETTSRSILGLPKRWMSKIEDETGIHTYSEVYEPMESGRRARSQMDLHTHDAADTVFGNLKPRQREKYQAVLEAKDKDKAFDVLKLKSGDRQRLARLQGEWEHTFNVAGLEDGRLAGNEQGPTTRAEEYLTRFKPLLRQTARDLGPDASVDEVIEKAFPTGVPKSVQYFKDMYHEGLIGYNDTDGAAELLRHGRHASWRMHLEERDAQIRSAFVHNENIPGPVRSTVEWYLNQVRGAHDESGRDLAAVTLRALRKLPGNENLKLADVQDFANGVMSMPYAGTMGAKPGPVMRNSLQTLMSGYSELGKYWLKGLKLAASKDGPELAKRLGLFEGQPTFMQSEFEEAFRTTNSKLARVGRAMSRISGGALRRYGNVDNMNRSVMGLGSWLRGQDAIRKSGGNVEKYLDHIEAFSDGYFPQERNVIQQLARSGDLQEASRRAAIATADNTQWLMSSGNRPRVTSGTAGRTMGMFYPWGAYYANYLKRLMPGIPASAKLMMGNANLRDQKNAIRLGRFLVANGALATGAYEIGTHSGIKDAGARMLSWLGLGPAVYTAGPYVETARAGLEAANEAVEDPYAATRLFRVGKLTPQQSEFAREARTFVPYGGLARDFQHLISPDKGEDEAVLRTMGLMPRTLVGRTR